MQTGSISYQQNSSNDIKLELEVLEEELLKQKREEKKTGVGGVHFFIAHEDRDLAGFIKTSLLNKFNKAHVSYANDTETILALLKQEEPNLIISAPDITNSDGRTLIQVLQSNELYQQIKILIVMEKRLTGKIAGIANNRNVKGILFKPFSSEQLIEEVLKILSENLLE